MIVNAGYRGKVGAVVPKFTYTGTYNVRDDGIVELLTSGTLVFLNPAVIDVFCVGGGGSGGGNAGNSVSKIGYGGGGGGKTSTLKKINVSGSVEVTIGAGGTYASRSDVTMNDANGKATAFGDYLEAAGGVGHYYAMGVSGRRAGTAGGSGGGGGVSSNPDYGAGGSDGENGEQGYPTSTNGGNGQGSTTKEFGEPNGKLYAGGGGGGRYMVSDAPIISPGGSGGGGAGSWITADGSLQAAGAGGANTGGGGGGGAKAPNQSVRGAAGGSGIVCFRAAK